MTETEEIHKPSLMTGWAGPKSFEALRDNAIKLGMVLVKQETTKKGLIKFRFEEIDYAAKMKAFKKSGNLW